MTPQCAPKLGKKIERHTEDLQDINHTKNNLAPHLEGLQKTHKALTWKVIIYLQKCFSFVLTQNKNDEDKVRLGLINIVNHAFGNHNKCEQSWCGFAQNPNTYKHSNLPYGKDLQGMNSERNSLICFKFKQIMHLNWHFYEVPSQKKISTK